MKVFLDDERKTPEGWFRVYEPMSCIGILETGLVTHISLDHDLGDDELIGTGNDVLVWIEEQVMTNNFKPPRIIIHSANPSAGNKMRLGVEQIRKLYENSNN